MRERKALKSPFSCPHAAPLMVLELSPRPGPSCYDISLSSTLDFLDIIVTLASMTPSFIITNPFISSKLHVSTKPTQSC